MEREELMERISGLELLAGEIKVLAAALSHDVSDLLADMEDEEMLSGEELETEEESEDENEDQVFPERKRKKR